MSKTDKNYRVDGVVDMEISKVKESSKKDVFFYDHRRQCLQNFFLVTTVSKKACGLRPVLLMKHSQKWKEGSSKWLVALTNWTKNNQDAKMVYWSDTESAMTLDTTLETSAEFKDIMSLTT